MKKIIYIICFAFLLIGTFVFAYTSKDCTNYYNNAQYQRASSCYYSLMNIDSNNPVYKLGYANSLYAQKRYYEAKTQYTEIIQKFSGTKAANAAKNNLAIVNETLKSISSSKAHDSGDYLSLIKTAKWTNMPIKVWIQQGEYNASAKRAFVEWQNKTKSVISFTFVQNPKEARLIVIFKSSIGTTQSGDTLGLTKLFSTPNGVIHIGTIDIKTTTQTGEKQSQNIVYSVTLHEIGHALGIKGHSNNKYDVMYPSSDNYRNALSNRDVNTILSIYK